MYVNKLEQAVIWALFGWLVGASSGLTIGGITGSSYGMIFVVFGLAIGFFAGFVYGWTIPVYKRYE